MGYANLNVHKLLYKPWQMHKITVCVTHGICSFLVCINHWKCIVQSALAMANAQITGKSQMHKSHFAFAMAYAATTSGANQRTHPARPPAPIRLFCKWAGVVFIAWAGCFFSSSIWPVLLLSNDFSSGQVLCCVHSLRTELAVVASAVYPTDLRSLCTCDCNGTVRNRNPPQVSFVCNVLLCCGLLDTHEAWASSTSP